MTQKLTFFGLALVLGIRFLFEMQLAGKFKAGQGVTLRYCLTSQPYYGKSLQTFYYQNHFQRIKISTGLDKIYDFGDCLQINGKIDYCSLPSKTKYCLLNPAISTYRPPPTVHLLIKIRDIRQKLADFYLENLPYPYSDLLSGIVLGVEKDLDENFHNQLRRTGTLHIIVASGFNLTVSAKRPTEFLAYLIGRKYALLAGFVFIWFYVSLVGWQPPVVRAGLMLSFVFLGQLAGRKVDQWRSLFLVDWLMLMAKPDLIASVSFQLSFAALLGIMIGGIFFKKLTAIPLIGGDLAETLSAQLIVTPIISYHFGQLSILAPVTNALILPLVPKLTWVGISALVGLFWPALGRLILVIVYPILWWIVEVVRRFGRLSAAEIEFGLSFLGVAGFYLIVFLVFHIKSKARKNKKVTEYQPTLFADY